MYYHALISKADAPRVQALQNHGLAHCDGMLSSCRASCKARFAVVDTTARPPHPPWAGVWGLPLVAFSLFNLLFGGFAPSPKKV
jgi:hypothetical protein